MAWRFRVAARLPMPVQYAGAAAMAGLIWVFGGRTATGVTDVISDDPVTGAAAVVGRLPYAVQGAAVIILGRADLRRGRGDRARNQPDGIPVRSGHVPV